MNEYTWVGERLRTCRLEAGLSPRELADRVGVDVDILSDIESGASARRFGIIVALAMALEVDPRTLFDAAPAAQDALRQSGGKTNKGI